MSSLFFAGRVVAGPRSVVSKAVPRPSASRTPLSRSRFCVGQTVHSQHRPEFQPNALQCIRSISTFSPLYRQYESDSSTRPIHLDIGIAYASKNTPPFVTPREAAQSLTTGFALPRDEAELASGKRSNRWLKVARWKEAQLALGGGRVELLGATPSASSSQKGDNRNEQSGAAARDQVEEEHEQRMKQQANEAQRRAWGAGEDFFFVGDEGHAVSLSMAEQRFLGSRVSSVAFGQQ